MTERLAPLRWWHLAEVVELERVLFGDESWSEELFWSELAQGGQRTYTVALDGTSVVGYCGLAAAADEAYVQTIAVAPAAQGRGLGTRLLRGIVQDAVGRGARFVGLEVRADNEVAQRLYARHDFAPVGRRRGYYQPSGVDAVVMVRELGRGAR